MDLNLVSHPSQGEGLEASFKACEGFTGPNGNMGSGGL